VKTPQLLLEQVSALQNFTNIFSCDAIQKTKPHPDVYALPKQDAEGDVWMVAVHAWDIAGAAYGVHTSLDLSAT
jgi:2-haloacid dehalogenase